MHEIQENKDKVARANPITYVGKDSPPFLLIHGDADPVVPLGTSPSCLSEALKKAGVDVRITWSRRPGTASAARKSTT